MGVAFLELLEDTDLDLAGVAVFLDGTDDLDGDAPAGVVVEGLYDFAEGALAKETDDAICRRRRVDRGEKACADEETM